LPGFGTAVSVDGHGAAANGSRCRKAAFQPRVRILRAGGMNGRSGGTERGGGQTS